MLSEYLPEFYIHAKRVLCISEKRLPNRFLFYSCSNFRGGCKRGVEGRGDVQSVTPLAGSPVAGNRSCAVFVCAFVRPLGLRRCPPCDAEAAAVRLLIRLTRTPGARAAKTNRYAAARGQNKKKNPVLVKLTPVVASACWERIRYVPTIVRQLRSVCNSDRPRITYTVLRRKCTPACVAHAGQRGDHVKPISSTADRRGRNSQCGPFCVVYS